MCLWIGMFLLGRNSAAPQHWTKQLPRREGVGRQGDVRDDPEDECLLRAAWDFYICSTDPHNAPRHSAVIPATFQ